MRNFQVIPIKLSLKSNKYAKSREIVSESQLTSPAVDLIAAGFIKEVFKEEVVEEKETSTETDPVIKKESIADIKSVNKK